MMAHSSNTIPQSHQSGADRRIGGRNFFALSAPCLVPVPARAWHLMGQAWHLVRVTKEIHHG